MKKLLLPFALLLSTFAFAQKIKLVEGNLSVLKGEKEITTEFSYKDMMIGKEGDLTEADYLKRKKADYDKDEPGRGDKFEKAWFADREKRFEPQFDELFVKYSKMTLTNNAKYTLLFKTTRTEPGWNVGVMRAPARIYGEAYLIETAHPKNILAKFTVNKAPGRDAMGFDFDSGVRIQEAYAKTGKELGILVADAR